MPTTSDSHPQPTTHNPQIRLEGGSVALKAVCLYRIIRLTYRPCRQTKKNNNKPKKSCTNPAWLLVYR